MRVVITSHYLKVVLEILDNEGWLEQARPHIETSPSFTLLYDNDDLYPQLRTWASDALGCTLIYGFNVER